MTDQQPLELVDYPGRGGGQIIRFMLEYFHIPYKDVYMELPSSINVKTLFTATYFYPMIKDGDFYVEGVIPVSKYVCRKANRYDFLGKTAEDAAKIQEILIRKQQYKNSIINDILPRKELFQEGRRDQLLRLAFEDPIRKAALIQLNERAGNQEGALGYLSVIDFFMYQISFKMSKIYPEMKNVYPNFFINFPKRFEQIDKIKEYLQSGRINNSKGIMCPGLCNQTKQKDDSTP